MVIRSFLHRLAVLLALFVSTQVIAKEFAFFHENVLGTSLELRVNATDESAAVHAESLALAEIDRLNSIYSHYNKSSEFSKFVSAPSGKRVSISNELRSTLQLCDFWKGKSDNAFNASTELITLLWQKAALEGSVPSSSLLSKSVQQMEKAHWEFDSQSGTVMRTSTVPLSLNAIAKGVILDRVADLVREKAEVQGLLVNIGGDIRVVGAMNSTISIADPRSDAINGPSLSTLRIADGAVATSGVSERFIEIAGRRYHHIFNPQTGVPVSHAVSATVIANEASTADALATICSVLSVPESVALVNSIPGCACLLASPDGLVTVSENWPRQQEAAYRSKATTLVSDQTESTLPEMSIEFEIAKSDDSRRYRRPYVALWIEDEDQFPVKTLSLFLMKDNPGPRWHRDLRRWYSDDQVRKLVDDKDLIETVSKPTRNPGNYKVTWDGNDDAGNPLKPGKYTLLVEAAREHGSYQLMKHEFELGTPFEKSMEPNEEISAVKIRYVAK